MIHYKRHWAYLKYIAKHKWYVLVATRQTRTSLLRGLIHDLSKFKPSEWFPYARCFYADDGSNQYDDMVDFKEAWLHHQNRNKHHWQYWELGMDDGRKIAMKMPDKYVREMLADWMGAGRAITGKWEVGRWYENNKTKMTLHPMTKEKVESLLSILKYYGN